MPLDYIGFRKLRMLVFVVCFFSLFSTRSLIANFAMTNLY